MLPVTLPSAVLIASLIEEMLIDWLELDAASPMLTVVPLTLKLAVAPAARLTAVLPPTRSAGAAAEPVVRPSALEVRVDSFTVIVSEASEPTMTVTPDENALLPSSRLWPL